MAICIRGNMHYGVIHNGVMCHGVMQHGVMCDGVMCYGVITDKCHRVIYTGHNIYTMG